MLKDVDLTIDPDGTVREMPPKNKNCPCKSKKKYKNCECSIKDQQRRDDFISKMTKKIEETRPIDKKILML